MRVLIVDDHDPWRRYASTTLQKQHGLHVIGEVSDGLEAVQKAEELQPDLILLDIGLPTLNGIEAARRIRKVSPGSKILFVSENRSADVAEKALSTGASGYVVKSDAAGELLPAVEAVLEGNQFVSASLAGLDLVEPTDNQGDSLRRDSVVAPYPARTEVRHEVEFYADDTGFVDGFAHFIEAALKQGNAVIVIATESHQSSLRQRLTADGLNVAAEIEQGSYSLGNWQAISLRKQPEAQRENILTSQSVEKPSTLYLQRVTWRRRSCSNTCGTRSHNVTK